MKGITCKIGNYEGTLDGYLFRKESKQYLETPDKVARYIKPKLKYKEKKEKPSKVKIWTKEEIVMREGNTIDLCFHLLKTKEAVSIKELMEAAGKKYTRRALSQAMSRIYSKLGSLIKKFKQHGRVYYSLDEKYRTTDLANLYYGDGDVIDHDRLEIHVYFHIGE